MTPITRPPRTGEDVANWLTHAVGAVLAGAAAAALVVMASLRGDAARVVGVSIFGVTLVWLYLASTVYHLARDARRKAWLRKVDHASIYLLIAGTYSPFVLGPLRGGWGWALFGVTWGLAIAGIVFKVFWTGRFPRLSTAVYIAMGWVALVAIVPIAQRLSPATIAWLVAGGLAYTGGVAFYAAHRLPYAHAVWHLFVLLGSACHTVAIAQILT